MPDSRKPTADEVVREVYRLENVCRPAPADDSFRQTPVVFGQVGGRELSGTLFQPRRPAERPRPAVVYLHGGGWSGGSFTQFDRHAAAMTAHGYAGLCVDYRLSGEAPFPAALEDAKCAVRYLRAHADQWNVDGRRIGAAGGSAGAHLAGMLAATGHSGRWEGQGGWPDYPSDIQAAVLFNGEFDLPAWWRGGLCNEFMLNFLGKPCEQDPELYRQASPITHVDDRTPPCLLLHGELDDAVPIQQSVDFHDRIRACGGRSELVRVPAVGHAWFNHPPHFEPCLRKMMDYFLTQLG